MSNKRRCVRLDIRKTEKNAGTPSGSAGTWVGYPTPPTDKSMLTDSEELIDT